MNGLVAAAAEAEAILKRARRCRGNARSFVAEEPDDTRDTRDVDEDDDDDDDFAPRRDNGPSPVKRVRRTRPKFDIHEKLRELYHEFASDETLQANYQGLRVSSYLLEKLLARVNLNVLIVNLYPGNKGYSISLKVNGDTHILSPPADGTGNISFRTEETLMETARWPYEEEDLLSYIDNEELPIVLLDLLETEYSCLFYSGCIIAQIRDFRQSYPNFVCDTHHVLLKPTTQSIINDVNAIVRSGSWGREERLLLESAVILATAPPLCLEPHPAIGLLASRLHHQRHLLSTPEIRRQAKKFSQVAINRKRRLDQLSQHRGLRLLDVINKQRSKMATTTRHSVSGNSLPRMSSKFPKKPNEVLRAVLAPQVDDPILVAPPDVANTVARLARPYERPRTSSDCAPQLMEEYILETERAASSNSNIPPGVFHIKLSILQRPSNQEYLGELYVDRDHVEGERNGSACRFLLGTRTHANRYIQQFTEIFTEEGRKSVRIKHIVPGQPPKISYTAAMRELNNAAQLRAVAAATATAPVVPLPSGVSPTVQAGPVGGVVSQHSLVSAIKVPPPSPAVPSPTGVTGPAPSPEVVLVTGPNTSSRRTISASLPLLQAQLQSAPQAPQIQSNQQVGSPAPPIVGSVDHGINNIKPQTQTLNSIHHILKQQTGDPQLQTVQIAAPQNASQIQIQNAQQTANQLLAQQLTSPPQPINPHKLQSAIIHIQHPLSGHLLQQKLTTNQSQIQTQGQHVTLQARPGITIQGQPGISLQGQQNIAAVQGQQNVTLQGQQAIAMQGQGVALQGQPSMGLNSQGNAPTPIAPIQKTVPSKQRTSNAAISALVTSLMNSAHQFQQQEAAKSTANAGNAANTPGSNATILNLLNSAPAAMTNNAGTGPVVAEGIPSKKIAPQSALLERLMAPPAPAAPNQQNPQQLGILPQLQNVQVQFPGLAQPISLSLNVSAAGGPSTGLLVSVPVSQPTAPSTQSILQLPITHLMASNVKAGTPLQLVQRPRVAPRQLPTKLPTATVQSGSVQYVAQPPASNLIHQQRRRSNPSEPSK